MNKCLVAILIVLGLTSCSAKDEHYYQTHPKELQQAMQSCPEIKPEGLTCEQLATVARRINSLAYQLQSSPQGFGNKILALQETIAGQQKQLALEKNNSTLQTTIAQNEEDLAEHMAVVKWLESPAS